jgi:hypothetical protein
MRRDALRVARGDCECSAVRIERINASLGAAENVDLPSVVTKGLSIASLLSDHLPPRAAGIPFVQARRNGPQRLTTGRLPPARATVLLRPDREHGQVHPQPR